MRGCFLTANLFFCTKQPRKTLRKIAQLYAQFCAQLNINKLRLQSEAIDKAIPIICMTFCVENLAIHSYSCRRYGSGCLVQKYGYFSWCK